MVVSEWHIRVHEDEIDEEQAYYNDPNLFSIKIHHGGYFTNPPNREYKSGTFSYFDMVDVDLFSVIDLNEMICQLGYEKKDIMHYHYKIPSSSLDSGLLSLASDVDVRSMIKDIGNMKRIEVYVEHSQVRDMGQGNDSVKEHDNIDSGMGEGSEEDDNDIASDRIHGTGMGQGSEEDDSDEEDSDYIEDEDHMMNEVEVDMKEYLENIDTEVEWVGPNNENFIEKEVENFEHGINLDDFESASDSENEGKRKKALRKLKRDHEANRNVEPKSSESFYVGQQFTDKQSIKSMVYSVSVATRRQLYIWKNDKLRVRVVCRGKTPVFTYPNVNGPSGSSPSKLKNIGGKWVKQKSATVNGPIVTSPSKLVNVGGKWVKQKSETVTGPIGTSGSSNVANMEPGMKIKVGKKNGVYQYQEITCPWVCHISKLPNEETWEVKTFEGVHNCLQNRKVNMLTNSFLSKEIEETIVMNPDVPVRALQDQLERKYQLNVSESKVYRAKEKATLKVQGDYRDQYGLLRDYALELQRTNPDTTVKIDIERCCDPAAPERQFKRIYVCIGALKKGFKAGLKDLLGLDGCHMKGPFPGQLLSAVGVDPNHGTYPLAYALVEAETISSWTWFLTCLGDDLELCRNSNFTFISDRQKGIVPAIAKLFPCAEHRFCLRHIHENMKLQWKGELYKELLWKCATSTTVPYFDKAMNELRKEDEKAYDFLKKIPPHHWSRAHFSGRPHCDVLLNNICEVFNRQLLDGRDVPILTCLEFVREYLMKRIVNVQKVIAKCKGPLTPAAAKLFKQIETKAKTCRVQWNGGHKYGVTGPSGDQVVVDVHEKTCTCRKWELTGMPCKHALASIWNMATYNMDVGTPESWVHPAYWLVTWQKVYSFKINPLNGKHLWSKHPSPNILIPPKHKPQVGRPTKKRKKSASELSSQNMVDGGKLSRVWKSVTCNKCHQSGHNRRTCNGRKDGSTSGAQTRSAKKKGKKPMK